MIQFSFPVVSHGKRNAKVTVRVFDDREAMLRSLRRYHAKMGREYEDGWYANTAAATSPYARLRVPRGQWRHEVTIRLVIGNCGVEVVSHEACHAALYIYREQVQQTIPDMEREEIFCHLVSEIVEAVIEELDEAGCYG